MTTETSATREDEELVELMIAYQAGDAGAFERLYAILADGVRRYFARAQPHPGAAHDLVQDLFLEMHRSRRSYSPPLPVRPWVFGIARNVLARHRRSAFSRAVESHADALEDAAGLVPASAAAPGDALDIEHAVTSLPASTREPWLLHHVFGLTFDTIAARLGITVMAAKLRSSRATRALRLALQATRSPR